MPSLEGKKSPAQLRLWAQEHLVRGLDIHLAQVNPLPAAGCREEIPVPFQTICCRPDPQVCASVGLKHRTFNQFRAVT